jgi:hypothetical protein
MKKQDTPKPIMIDDINKEYRRKMKARKRPARMTVADLIKDEQVPMAVRLWLEDFTEQGDKALAHSWTEQEQDTLDLARLIQDVLNSQGQEHGEHTFPEEARDYIEEYLFRLCRASEFNIWNLADAAIAALPTLLECAENSIEGNPNYIAVDSAILRLTTREERREFLTEPRYGQNDEGETNTEAAFKLSRLLADPRTSADVRRQLQGHTVELCNAANVIVDHPALARRAFLVACDQRPKGHVREVKAARRALLALLDTLPEMADEKGGGEQ